MQARSILVTGGLGYIGSHCVVVLLQAGYDVVILDNASNSFEQVLEGIYKITTKRPVYICADITDRTAMSEIFATHHIDAVMHFAAKKAVGESMEQPHIYYHNNVVGTQVLLAVMQEYGVNHIIFSSTCAVYSPAQLPPYTEDMQTGPESIYALTKLISEQMIQGLTMCSDFKAFVLRYFNPIGNHPSGYIGENPKEKPLNIMPIITECLEGKRESLLVFGDDYDTRDGTAIRDYIHVMDLADAHIYALQKLLQQEKSRIYDVINLGTGTGSTVLEIIQAVQSGINRTVPYTIVPRRAGDLPAVYGNCDKAKILLGRTAQRSVADAIRDLWVYRAGL